MKTSINKIECDKCGKVHYDIKGDIVPSHNSVTWDDIYYDIVYICPIKGVEVTIPEEECTWS